MEMQELMLTNRSGKRMPATLLLPTEAPNGTVVIFHGLAGWKDQRLLVRISNFFSEAGYAVLRFDESDGVTSPDGDPYNETTTQYTEDAEDVVAYVRKQPWCTGTLTLVGHSMGGLVAAWYAAHHPDEVSRLVLLAPAVSPKMMQMRELPFSLFGMIRRHEKQLTGYAGNEKFRLSPRWWVDFQKFDGGTDATKIEVPTLIISAEHDGTVATPAEHREYTKAFSNAEHATISWSDHDFDGHEDEVIAAIQHWLS